MPTSAEPSVQLVGNLATWPRPFGSSSVTSNSQQHATIGAAKSVKENIAKERLVYAVIQKQSSGRWRQIIQVRIKKKKKGGGTDPTDRSITPLPSYYRDVAMS